MFWCQKGCDFGRGKMSDELKRTEADNMCKMMAQSTYALNDYEDLDEVEDMRIHATMYPNNPLTQTCFWLRPRAGGAQPLRGGGAERLA